MSTTPAILFDRTRLRKRRQRAAADFAATDFLLQQAAESLAESLAHLSYTFPTIVELGASGRLKPLLAHRPGTRHYYTLDSTGCFAPDILADEEWLPLAEGSCDAIVSAGALHWVNDLPGTLAQIHRALKPDGLFIATMPGPDSLRELRQVFAATDAARLGGLTSRIAPFPDVRDAGGLLQRAGFALPVVDRELVTVTYPSLWALMQELRCSAQTNMLQHQLQQFTTRGYFAEAERRYREGFMNTEGRLIATFECVTLTGWKPAANQQQPSKRGSGQLSLGAVLGD